MQTVRVIAAAASLLLVATPTSARRLTFTDRLRAQEAIERVYYRHQIGATLPFEGAVPREVLERKVRAYLNQRDSGATITPAMLKAERDRIDRSTRFPGRLQEVYAALDHDAATIEECFVRPVLLTRLAAPTLQATPAVLASDSGADRWVPVSEAGAPSPRYRPASVWTGSLLIVWGGETEESEFGHPNTGARYDPLTDTWTRMTTRNAPEGRQGAAAVWTGSVMVVWGGARFVPNYVNTGGLYDPLTDTWTAISTTNAPSARSSHSWVWTGTEMIVWGGGHTSSYFNDGGRYNPATDTWQPVSTTNAPSPRVWHSAVWTGDRMLVWAGALASTYYNDGAMYDPSADRWAPISNAGAPPPRGLHSAVWTGGEMLVWGGYNGGSVFSGGRYSLADDSWSAIPTLDAPHSGYEHRAVWTGTDMLVWGGRGTAEGGRFDPPTDTWTPTSADGVPSPRGDFASVWTGCEMIVWGGFNGSAVGTGGRYLIDDADRDAVSGLCDNCPAEPNADQGDLDGDFEGDACDLDDGLIFLKMPSPDSLSYQLEQGRSHFNIYRGSLSHLLATGVYTQDPALVPDAARFCQQTGGTLADAFVPAAGEIVYYLATGADQAGQEGSLGTDSAGRTRLNHNPCP